MKIEYKSNKLKKQLTIPVETRKSFGNQARRVTQRMEEMMASDNLHVLCQIPQANCHPLTGNRAGEWAVDISANHRIIFTIDQDPIPEDENGGINKLLVTDIRIIAAGEDYH